MIRTLLLVVSFVALSLCGSESNGQYFTQNARLGSGPFCDSKCLPDGDWRLRRDWTTNDEEEIVDKFLWMADGDATWWAGNPGCGHLVNDMIFTSVAPATSEVLQACRPEVIYMFEYNLDYVHGSGHMFETLQLDSSFSPTTQSWTNFVNEYFNNPTSRVTKPWNLLRMIPDIAGEPVIDDYDDLVVLSQTFLANYERNFCSFTMSLLPLNSRVLCAFNFDDDDTETLDGYVSADFCEYLTGSSVVNFDLETCGDGTNSEPCDHLNVHTEAQPKLAGRKFKELSASIRHNAQVTSEEVSGKELRAKRETSQYNFGYQPIPYYCSGIGCSFPWNDVGSHIFYTYVPYTSSIASPYCAYRA